jgi:hypothetical protein
MQLNNDQTSLDACKAQTMTQRNATRQMQSNNTSTRVLVEPKSAEPHVRAVGFQEEYLATCRA